MVTLIIECKFATWKVYVLGFLFGAAHHTREQLVNLGIYSLIPEAEIFESISIIKISYVENIDETLDCTQFNQTLLADHFHIIKELFVSNS